MSKNAYDEYKMYLQTTEHTTSNRLRTNAFFISINTLLVNYYTQTGVKIEQLVLGTILCLIWYILLKSYKTLNLAKFITIKKTAKKYKFLNLYHIERNILEKYKNYYSLSSLESIIPILFIIYYSIQGISIMCSKICLH